MTTTPCQQFLRCSPLARDNFQPPEILNRSTQSVPAVPMATPSWHSRHQELLTSVRRLAWLLMFERAVQGLQSLYEQQAMLAFSMARNVRYTPGHVLLFTIR